MSDKILKTLNGYTIYDEEARTRITSIEKDYASTDYVDEAVSQPVNALADGKVDKNQGTENNGKLLGVVDGYVVLVDAPSGTTDAVRYVEQELTEEQQEQARANIGAANVTYDTETKTLNICLGGGTTNGLIEQIEDYVIENEIEKIVIDGVEVNLSRYAKKEETDRLSQEISDLKENGVVGSSVEPKEDDIPKVFFSEAIPQTKDDVVTGFRYISKTKDISGFAEFKAQGNSSMNYPKKNMTVKMYKDEALEEKLKVDFKNWGEQRKHVYKANWIDLTHARNIVSARLWADVVKTRADYELLPELLRTSPNQGAVDGFPVKVYSQGIYQGRYTLNIPKDAWMANMDDSLDEHCILCGEGYNSGCFRSASMGEWTDEVHDSRPTLITNRWLEIINFVMNSTDEEFKANLGNYFFVYSLIDYFIFGMISCGLDAFGKNQLYMTYDGIKWIAVMYDMDSTWGLYWNGSKFVSASYSRTEFEDFVNGRQGNLLYIRLANLFYEEIQYRYEELKQSALSVPNIINRFERFTDIAPLDLVKEDYASTTGSGKFTGIPSQSTNNIQQIRKFVVDRYVYCDEYFASLGQTEPDIPDEPDEPEVDDVKYTLLRENYSPNGEKWSDSVSGVNWEANEPIVASIDLTNCTGSKENIFGVCEDVSLWKTVGIHLYYTASTKELIIDYVDSYGGNGYYEGMLTLTDNNLLLAFTNEGVKVNGKLVPLPTHGAANTSYPIDIINKVCALETVQIGSSEGNSRSNATYECVKVVKAS